MRPFTLLRKGSVGFSNPEIAKGWGWADASCKKKIAIHSFQVIKAMSDMESLHMLYKDLADHTRASPCINPSSSPLGSVLALVGAKYL